MIAHGHGWLMMAVMCAGAAAAGLVTSPAEQLDKVHTSGNAPRNRASPRLQKVRRRFAARDDAMSPWRRALLTGGAVIGIGQGVGGFVPGLLTWMIMLALGAGIFVVIGKLEPRLARMRRLQLAQDLPQLCELLAACLEAGLPLRTASAQVAATLTGPAAELLEQVLTHIRVGQGDADAWRSLRDHPQLGMLAVDLARSVDSGTTMVETLVQHGKRARRHQHAARQATAKTAGVRSVLPLMVCFLPAFFLIGIVPIVASAITAFIS